MLQNLREKMQAIRQGYADDIDRLIDDVQQGRISGEEYREQASARRAKFFEDDKLVHAEMSKRVKESPDDVPAWLSNPPEE